MDEIKLASTEELLQELTNRNDNIVVVANKLLDDGKAELTSHVHGDPLVCLGLLEAVKPNVLPTILHTNNEE